MSTNNINSTATELVYDITVYQKAIRHYSIEKMSELCNIIKSLNEDQVGEIYDSLPHDKYFTTWKIFMKPDASRYIDLPELKRRHFLHIVISYLESLYKDTVDYDFILREDCKTHNFELIVMKTMNYAEKIIYDKNASREKIWSNVKSAGNMVATGVVYVTATAVILGSCIGIVASGYKLITGKELTA